MNKTFNMALAVAAAAGMVCAEIETAPAGYVDVAGGSFVSNPFDSFSGAANTLADIDGSAVGLDAGYIRVISAKGKKLFDARYLTAENAASEGKSEGAGWYVYANSAYGAFTNAHPLARGTSVQFNGSEQTITMAGTLSTENVQVTLVNGHNFVGNVSPVAKPLTSVSISNFDPDGGDYAYVNGVKYAYYEDNWYNWNDFIAGTASPIADNAVTIAAGQGIRIYCRNRFTGEQSPVVTLSGSFQ